MDGQAKVPAKIGRPTKYSEEWAETFCELIADGKSVRDICSSPAQPHKSQVYRWLDEDADFRDQYARAREAQADTLVAKIMTTVDGVEPEPGKVNKARLQFDAYRWHAGKLWPKKYGDHISHDEAMTSKAQASTSNAVATSREGQRPRGRSEGGYC
jgi:hypothetical protein